MVCRQLHSVSIAILNEINVLFKTYSSHSTTSLALSTTIASSFTIEMSLSQKLEANEKLPTTQLQDSAEPDILIDPFTPTPTQFVLILIGVLFALDRRGIIGVLPFHISLLGGFIPIECLIWTLILADMARKDIFQILRDIKG